MFDNEWMVILMRMSLKALKKLAKQVFEIGLHTVTSIGVFVIPAK
jgi:hypothetical protein